VVFWHGLSQGSHQRVTAVVGAHCEIWVSPYRYHEPYAHNIKVIAQDGKVMLRGPVR
jgi:hypothetical protein